MSICDSSIASANTSAGGEGEGWFNHPWAPTCLRVVLLLEYNIMAILCCSGLLMLSLTLRRSSFCIVSSSRATSLVRNGSIMAIVYPLWPHVLAVPIRHGQFWGSWVLTYVIFPIWQLLTWSSGIPFPPLSWTEATFHIHVYPYPWHHILSWSTSCLGSARF